MLWTQKNPFDSRRFFAIRSCVDLPEPSDHSTIMRVHGRSSVEKNISFLEEGDLEFSEGDSDFLSVAINRWEEYTYNIEKSFL